MSCLSLKELIARRNGLLTEEEQRQQVEHLAGCPLCQQLEQTLGKIGALLPLASAGQLLGATPACPDESELIGYLYARADESTAAQVRSHLADCRHCLGQVAALLAAEGQPLPSVGEEWQAAVQRAEGLVAESKESQGWRLGWVALRWRWAPASGIAALLVVAGLTWYQSRPGVPLPTQQAQRPGPAPIAAPPSASPEQEPTLLAQDTQRQPASPGGGPPPVQVREAPSLPAPSLGLVFPQEGQRVLRRDLEFRWQAVSGAHLYEVVVLDRQGNVIWETEAEHLSVRVPEDVPLRPGERYFVWVVARVDGESPLRSPSVAFEILPPSESQ